MRYNKLVRNKIPEIIRSKGKTPITHIASDKEYDKKLKEKLIEEVNEFINDSNIEELVDILEVINAICENKGVSFDDLEIIRMKKLFERGGFDKKIILDSSE